MYEQIHSQFVNYSKQIADAALKVNALALQNVERVIGLQVKTVESRVNAAIGLFGEAAEASDFDSAKAIWPKGVQFAKESAEQMVAVGQEVFGYNLKTTEAIAELVRGSIEVAGQAAERAAKPARAAK